MDQKIADLEKRIAELEKQLLEKQSNPEFESLKNWLNSPSWPSAVDPSLICNTSLDQDKEDRAEGILDMIVDTSLVGLSILDFGCGEGHLSKKALIQKPKISVGYDIQSFNWKQEENLFYSTDWQFIKDKGPYDIIVVYDVLDHISGEADAQVVEVLKTIKQVMKPNGNAYIRCHPFVSRHGTHLYHQINKAYVHLVFTPEELKKLGYKPTPHTRHVVHPVGTYRKWLQQANFKILKEQITNEPIEPFFTSGIVGRKIKENWRISPVPELSSGKKFPTVQIEQQFVTFQVI